jgi:adenosylcobinamide amidohydrolase
MVTSMVEIRCFSRWMTVRFPAPHRCSSWAVVNGGVVTADAVAWRFLELNEIEHCGDVRTWFADLLRRDGLAGAVGLLTSRRLHQHVESGDGDCHVIATVGLSNALAAGDLALTAARAGTINILCVLAAPLTIEASLEALALAAEARTAAMRDARVPSRVSGRDATGTGTDCIVIAHPVDGTPVAEYCGKHTAWGHRIGFHVHEAVSRGIATWLEEQRA